MKKVLFVATVVQKHINVFHLPFLKLFKDEGYKTYVAAANDTGKENVEIQYCDEYVEIDFKRNPLHPGNITAYKKLKRLIDSEKFDIIHCHTPVGGFLGRLAAIKARKKGTKVFYTAHGFHFYKGAPLKNWLMYYPVEKFCSRFTDVLITINQEDYALAKKKMKSKKVEYVPGVGIDLSRFRNAKVDRAEKRREIGVPEDAFLLVSVGEVNENKNHQIIVNAMALLNNPKIHYAIAGIGDQEEYLKKLSNDLGVSKQLHLLGYRKDIPEIDSCADVFCFPSLREGLGLGALEAMACGLPIITSNVHGINDYSEDKVTGYKCSVKNVVEYADAIREIYEHSDMREQMSDFNRKLVERYSVDEIVTLMRRIYE